MRIALTAWMLTTGVAAMLSDRSLQPPFDNTSMATAHVYRIGANLPNSLVMSAASIPVSSMASSMPRSQYSSLASSMPRSQYSSSRSPSLKPSSARQSSFLSRSKPTYSNSRISPRPSNATWSTPYISANTAQPISISVSVQTVQVTITAAPVPPATVTITPDTMTSFQTIYADYGISTTTSTTPDLESWTTPCSEAGETSTSVNHSDNSWSWSSTDMSMGGWPKPPSSTTSIAMTTGMTGVWVPSEASWTSVPSGGNDETRRENSGSIALTELWACSFAAGLFALGAWIA